jgi:hypothetical protein
MATHEKGQTARDRVNATLRGYQDHAYRLDVTILHERTPKLLWALYDTPTEGQTAMIAAGEDKVTDAGVAQHSALSRALNSLCISLWTEALSEPF